MGRGSKKYATVLSSNETEFGFPYSGRQRCALQLRRSPKYGQQLILYIERGQFLCIADCHVAVRFDSGRTQEFRAARAAGGDPTILFIIDDNDFLRPMRKANQATVEADFYREGSRVFRFEVTGLKWP